ncbi:MAG TPA: metalloregulator ArsR/SmtB family transcription factor [Acidimicrobiales bacterium]|nr:metalloregulator ArsR/SmtB family transcription factor [Acidimicrobiales bacterium]HVC69484.1 metalloregulator ArsR/SmtB family transcription factor [Acidimicrobiales bacterium]
MAPSSSTLARTLAAKRTTAPGSGVVPKDGDLLSARVRLFRVLGDPTRLRILELLLQGPRTVSELVAATGVPQPRVSTHLACLRWCKFVEAYPEGRRVTYSARDRKVANLLRVASALAGPDVEHLASCRRIGPDWV